MYKKKQLDILKKRLVEERRFIQIIAGPRQVGKTTLIKQLLEEIPLHIVYLSADNVTGSNWIEIQWDTLITKMNSSKLNEAVIVFDEIQKIPGWSEAVKKMWDRDTLENRNIKLVLLGSSQLLIQKGISESMAGRFEVIKMNQWNYSEMNEAFGYDEIDYLFFGGYPGSAGIREDEIRWKEYVLNSLIEPALYKDIMLMTRVDKPVLMRKLFDLGCSYSGQIVSYRKILGQLDDAGNVTTMTNYLSLLDSIGLLSGIEKYSLQKLRQRSSIPKWQVRDNSLLTVMTGKSISDIKNDTVLMGRFIESAIGAHLMLAGKENTINLYYWREGDKEIDFIIEQNNLLIAIEVKSNYSKSLKGLYEFKKRYDPYRSIVIERGGFDWQEFIKTDPVELFK